MFGKVLRQRQQKVNLSELNNNIQVVPDDNIGSEIAFCDSSYPAPLPYGFSDICVCCGAYMPEGAGMVCTRCSQQYSA